MCTDCDLLVRTIVLKFVVSSFVEPRSTVDMCFSDGSHGRRCHIINSKAALIFAGVDEDSNSPTWKFIAHRFIDFERRSEYKVDLEMVLTFE